MEAEEKLTLTEAHLKFAKEANGHAWKLLEKQGRTPDDDDEMLEAVYASYYHWRAAGTAVHLQRGEWFLAHVYTVLGGARNALRHAWRCSELTENYKDQMTDFDLAYRHECLARALAVGGNLTEARRIKDLARAAGEAIEDEEDRAIFMGDLNGGDWYGL